VSRGSVSFTWAAVADVGDGSGADYVVAGLDHYTSWYTDNGGPPAGRADTTNPLIVVVPGTAADDICIHASATDKVRTTSPEGSVCATPASPPPVPPPPPALSIQANPVPGLTGLPGWFWLDPAPTPQYTTETWSGNAYRILAAPTSTDWSFGDGDSLASGGFGAAYPAESDVQHVYQAQSATGYPVSASVNYSLSWFFLRGSFWVGPFAMGGETVPAPSLLYPVEQAQPELQGM